jgi:polyphosphate glucokinase
LGRKKWSKGVHDVVAQLKNALQADYVVLGGGNAKRFDTLPPGTFAGNNTHACEGGFRLWQSEKQRKSLAAVGD